MKLLPVILGGRANDPKNYYIFKSVSKNPTISGITTTSEILVITISNGQEVRETYPAGTTSIAFKSDPNKEIRIIGDISKLTYAYGTIQEMTARSRALTSFATSYQGSGINIEKIDFSYCPNITSINLNSYNNTTAELLFVGCVGLTSFSWTAAATLKKASFAGCTSLSSLSMTNASAVTHVDVTSCPALSSLALSYARNLSSLSLNGTNNLSLLRVDNTGILSLDISNQTLLSTLDCRACPRLETVRLSSIATLDEIDFGQCFSLSFVENFESQIHLTKLSLGGCELLPIFDLNVFAELTSLSVSNTAFHVLKLPALNSLKTITLDADCIEFSNPNNTALENIYGTNLTALEILDIASADNLSSGGSVAYSGYTPLRLVKFRAVYSGSASTIAGKITNSSVDNGVVYLNDQDAYYSTVADAATAKGWTIEPLA